MVAVLKQDIRGHKMPFFSALNSGCLGHGNSAIWAVSAICAENFLLISNFRAEKSGSVMHLKLSLMPWNACLKAP